MLWLAHRARPQWLQPPLSPGCFRATSLRGILGYDNLYVPPVRTNGLRIRTSLQFKMEVENGPVGEMKFFATKQHFFSSFPKTYNSHRVLTFKKKCTMKSIHIQDRFTTLAFQDHPPVSLQKRVTAHPQKKNYTTNVENNIT